MGLSDFLQPINYAKIQETIKPWVDAIYNEEYPYFYRGFTHYLNTGSESTGSADEKILLFLFFTLLPHFYKTECEKEVLFIKLIRETPKLDLEKTNEQVLKLYFTTVCPLTQLTQLTQRTLLP